jgi:putative PIN family toxin of toxin-antitoxin system
MLAQTTSPSPLLVLDTNVVLDWIAFDDQRVRPIAAAIEGKALPLVSNDACLQELRRALAYTQVKLDAGAQARALGRYLAQAEMFEPAYPANAADLPRCEDADDQKFIELAWHARASHLLTRDKALLKLARRLSDRFAVLAPDAFLEWMSAQARPWPHS